MFREGSHGSDRGRKEAQIIAVATGEQRRKNSRPPEMKAVAVTSDVGSGRDKATGFQPGSNREIERGTSVREKERDAAKGVAR